MVAHLARDAVLLLLLLLLLLLVLAHLARDAVEISEGPEVVGIAEDIGHEAHLGMACV